MTSSSSPTTPTFDILQKDNLNKKKGILDSETTLNESSTQNLTIVKEKPRRPPPPIPKR